MKTIPTLIVIAFSIHSPAESHPDESKAQESLAEIHTNKEIPEPTPRSKKIRIPERYEDLQVFVLKPVKVKIKEEHFTFDHERSPNVLDEPFTWKNGGILYENYGEKVTTKIGIQYDARNNGIRFLSFSF